MRINPVPLSIAELAAIARRASKATQGPLYVVDLKRDDTEFSVGNDDPSKRGMIDRLRRLGKRRRWKTEAPRADTVFEAAAHEDIPKLLGHIAALDRLVAQCLDRVKGVECRTHSQSS